MAAGEVDMAAAEKSKGRAIDEPEPRREEGAQSEPQGVHSRKRCAGPEGRRRRLGRNAATSDEPASHRPSGSWFYHDVKVCLSPIHAVSLHLSLSLLAACCCPFRTQSRVPSLSCAPVLRQVRDGVHLGRPVGVRRVRRHGLERRGSLPRCYAGHARRVRNAPQGCGSRAGRYLRARGRLRRRASGSGGGRRWVVRRACRPGVQG